MTYAYKSLLALAVLAVIGGSAGASEVPVAEAPQAIEPLDNPAALTALALKHEHAEGVPRNYAKAAELYCRAARLGYADAQYALGWMYANGRGVARDDAVAALLFGMAQVLGHPHAGEMLRYLRPATPAPVPACLFPDPPVIKVEHELTGEVYASNDVGQPMDASDPLDDMVYFKGPIFDLVYRLAPDYDIDPRLVLAVILVESNFNVHARSPKNAQGLMQLIPETAQRFRVKNVYDPADNIRGGLAYLQWLLAFFKGNVPLVAAAYNSGERTVEKYRGVPPYPETKAYVRKITKLYRSPTHPYKSNLVSPARFVALPVSR
jgi:TPR repeat protein